MSDTNSTSSRTMSLLTRWNEEERKILDKLARMRGVSRAGLLRSLVLKEAKREGVTVS